MKIQISDKKKKEAFVSLFQILKNCSSLITTKINSESLHIQGMDKSHICLFEVNIHKDWFDEYIVDESSVVSFDTNIFHLILNSNDDCSN